MAKIKCTTQGIEALKQYNCPQKKRPFQIVIPANAWIETRPGYTSIIWGCINEPRILEIPYKFSKAELEELLAKIRKGDFTITFNQ